MSMSPTARTLKWLRNNGWLVDVVERWVPGANKRKDLWGFVDVLAIKGEQVLAVQACARSSVSARVKKIAGHENIAAVRKLGWMIEVWGWGKKPNGRWDVRIVDCS